MAFGSSSAIFTQAMLNPIMAALWSTAEPTGFAANGLSADVINAALFNNTTTPDKDAAVGSTGYNTGVWITANEVTDSTNWVAGGRALGTKTFTAGTSVVAFDAADTAGGGNVTIANAYGCLIYDNSITAGTVAKQALCFNAFGSSQGVTGGSFTIVYDSTGVLKVTV